MCCVAHQRKKLESQGQDWPCWARRGRNPVPIHHPPPIANERLALTGPAMQRLAALVPRPRLHLINFHGVLAPNAKLLAEIIPSVPVNTNTPSADHGDAPLPLAPARISWARLLK